MGKLFAYLADLGKILYLKILKILQLNGKYFNYKMSKNKRCVSKEDTHTIIKHMKRDSTSVAMEKMLIKTTTRYHFMPAWIILF